MQFKLKHIQNFDIIHTHNPFKWYNVARWLSVAIRFFQHLRYGKSAWSGHTAIAIVDSDREVWILEADPTVKISKYAEWCMDKKISISRIPKSQFIFDDVTLKQEALSCLGTKYDFSSLIFFQTIYTLTGLWLGKKSESAAKRFYCSELVAYLIWFGTRKLFRTWWNINPAKLYQTTTNYLLVDKIKATDLLDNK